jgi:hypothetical protein
MSFLKSLFGLGKSAPQVPDEPPMRAYRGYTVLATPFSDKGQFQVCGIIRRTVGGVVQDHQFIRVDRMATRDEAVEFTFWKGEQMIDQMGDRLFKSDT